MQADVALQSKTIRSFVFDPGRSRTAASRREVIRPLIKITKKTFAVVKQQAAFLSWCVFTRAGNRADDRQSGQKIRFVPTYLESRKIKVEEEEEEKI